MSRRKSPSPRHNKHKSGKSHPHDAASWLYGIHTAMAALANPQRKVSRILTCDPALAAPVTDAIGATPQIAIESVSRTVLEANLPDGAVHQGIAVLASALEPPLLDQLCEQIADQPHTRIVVLDQVTDPHNIGAIIRTAAAFQATAVVVQDRHTPPVTGVLAKAASGGLEYCPLVRVTNLARALESLRRAGVWCIGLDSEASQTMQAAKVTGPMALVLGAEGDGLRRLTREMCDALAVIPYSGPLASLNVSNAAAIALYEISQIDQ
ncbi:MAG: 23S rRNA (guanosine(2251)-2'-O)-methyltransferase RlmB [Alphaproteobacteria bacterium]|nr:23S rRNA (guanosine(2251)-2'-O)-methyltransferase RlmB [Alphaproteobacteria bacterium]